MLAEPLRGQADIEREASEWLARWRLSPLTAQDIARFDAWRDADPRHRQAFAAMSRTLQEVASLQALGELAPIEPARPNRRRRALGAGIGAIAAGLAAVVLLPGVLNSPDIQASTLVAEVRPITLEDGTRVTLGASSEIKVHFDDGERRVRLTRGEAFFEIAEDGTRPFVVEAAGTEIRDIGTSFEVKRVAGRVEVGVLDGIVEVQPRGLLGREPVTRIGAGQRVQARRASLGPIVGTANIGPVKTATAVPGAWREGQLTYDDTRLDEVIADLNRYYAPGVRLDSGVPGEVRLAASFKADEIDKFLAELPSVAPVLVQRNDSGAVVIIRRPSEVPAG